ncbi:MAG: TIM barrel protein [Ignisphaera sp.]
MLVLYGFIRRKDLEYVSKFPWDIGIISFMLFPELMKSSENATEKIRLLLEDPFFDLIEVTVIDDNEWLKIAEVNKSYGKKFMLGLQPVILSKGLNPNALNDEERRKTIEILVHEVEKAGKRGYIGIGVCSGPNIEGPERSKAIDALVKSLIELSSITNKYGIKLFLETFDVVWDRKRLAGSLDETIKVIEKVREVVDNVYIMWDLSHAPLLNEDPEILKSYPDYIGHIHIGCAKKIDNKLLDTHPGFYRPGAINTEKDVAKLISVLHEIGYKGAISFEIRPEEGQNPLEILNSAKGVLLRAYQLYLEKI